MSERDYTPKGYRKIEAYTNGKEIVCLEWPEDDDDAHNCDALGCSTFSHVKYRVAIPDWQAQQKQPELPTPEAPRDFGPWPDDPVVKERAKIVVRG